MEPQIITYIRTKQLLNERLRHQTDNSVFIAESDLKRFNVAPAQLNHMINTGLLERTKKGIRAINAGRIDLSLIKPNCKHETDLHRWMKRLLLFIDLPATIQAPDYFSIFLQTRQEFLNLFFKVDDFAGRVHTPVSSLNKKLRPALLLMGEPVASLDVSQMQPTLLGSILYQHIGNNAFSDAITEGKDVYSILQSMAGLKTRDEAKKRFFEILFSKPSDKPGKLFSDGGFMHWINNYKNQHEPRNPHSDRPHTNLAWLLQSYEVFIMSQIWQRLAETGIPFLSVHDEIICRKQDSGFTSEIMAKILSNHFRGKFKVAIKGI